MIVIELYNYNNITCIVEKINKWKEEKKEAKYCLIKQDFYSEVSDEVTNTPLASSICS